MVGLVSDDAKGPTSPLGLSNSATLDAARQREVHRAPPTIADMQLPTVTLDEQARPRDRELPRLTHEQ